MLPRYALLLSSLLLLLIMGIAVGANPEPEVLHWRKLSQLPDPIGFAGSFAGVSGDALLVAGGANFQGEPPWRGGTKKWHDSVFVLEHPGDTWKNGGKLPRPLAYGVSVSTPEGIICAGGGDA